MNDATQFFTGGPGYEIERSLRFNSSDGAYLSRTPSVAGNRKTWTWAGWVKLSTSSAYIFAASSDNWGGNYTTIQFNGTAIRVEGSNPTHDVYTANIFRDYSAWMHLVVAFDTTQATAANRIKVYVNGVEAVYSTASYPAQNSDTLVNAAVYHQISGRPAGNFFNGYLADIHFIDGQALDSSSFTEFDDNGVLQPKAYEGTYGTNGFYLPFSDNSTAAALGTDTSGNSNTWTVNNISVAVGAGNDSLVDSPTNYGTDTGAGGEVRGNYCTWNPLEKDATTVLSNGNIDAASIPGGAWLGAAFATRSGKWYYEITTVTGQYLMLGVADYDVAMNSKKEYTNTGTYYYYGSNGQLRVNGANTTFPDSTTYPYANNAVIGIAFDCDAGTINFYLNGSKVGGSSNSITGLSGKLLGPALSAGSGGQSCTANFGQRPFAYTAPSGFKALCTTNLPEPTIADGSTAMDVVLDTGANILSAAQGAIGGSADLLWIKDRANSNNHQLIDTVRGGTATLQSNTTTAETTYVAPSGSSVAWTWDAGSSTVTNNDGSVTSQVRANASAGFSVVTWTSSSSSGNLDSIGHGLNVTPGLVITKRRTVPDSWYVAHSYNFANYLQLNSTAAASTISGSWGGGFNSSTFGLRVGNFTGTSEPMVAYCFAPVDGYSSFGSYTGNGLADGPFVYTGFRPRWLMVKRTDTANSNTNWAIYDTTRADNPNKKYLLANTSAVEGNFYDVDMLSNGFKLRLVGDTINQTNGTYIYAAFAEHPFATSRAR
jgi:hypothetical protein